MKLMPHERPVTRPKSRIGKKRKQADEAGLNYRSVQARARRHNLTWEEAIAFQPMSRSESARIAGKANAERIRKLERVE